MDPRLVALVERVWLRPDRCDAVVSVTSGVPPPGHRVVEQYAILPSAERPRLLVALGSRPVTVAAFHKYSAVKPPAIRAARLSLAAAFGIGLGELAFRDRLVVSVDEHYPTARLGDVLIIRHLGDLLGREDLRAVAAVRPLNPNAKVTLQLFDPHGVPVAFAKLGSSEATRETVRTEAKALAELDGRLSKVAAPRLLAAGDWGPIAYSVGSPLPEGMGRWTRDPAATPDVILDIVDSGPTVRQPLCGSSCARRLRAGIAAVHTGAPETARVLGAWLDRMERHPTPITFARSHGDWMPHNLGHVGSRVTAWDWENSMPDAPVGLDLIHWHFQHALERRGLPAAVAAADRATTHLGALGVPPESRSVLASLYLLEAFVRRAKLAVGGGGWNPRWYPGLLQVAAARDRSRG